MSGFPHPAMAAPQGVLSSGSGTAIRVPGINSRFLPNSSPTSLVQGGEGAGEA